MAGLSLGMAVAGIASPATGRIIQKHGGRPVLAASSILIAAALALMGTTDTPALHVFAWVLMGLGMAGGLYDAGFATLGRLYGAAARGPITTLTLFGGFASTVCWPLSALLIESFGWRAACLIYAGIHLLICLPLHLRLVPPPPVQAVALAESAETSSSPASTWTSAFILLALVLTLASLISSMVAVHLLSILQLRGMDLATAVALGALVGPAQVGGRLAEYAIGRNRHHPIWTMLASVTLLAVGILMLMASLPLTALALILYGAGNGIQTIARGALPLVMFDPGDYARLMGRLVTPSLIVQAVAPFLGAILIGHGEMTILAVLLGVALANVMLVLWLAATTRRA